MARSLPQAVHPAELQSPAVAAALDEVAFDTDADDLAWQDYLTAGGFPRAVFEHVTNDAVSDTYLAQPMFTTLTEATLAVALARSIDELDEGRWAVNDTIGYARTASTNEIDLASVAVPTGAGRAWTPIGCP